MSYMLQMFYSILCYPSSNNITLNPCLTWDLYRPFSPFSFVWKQKLQFRPYEIISIGSRDKYIKNIDIRKFRKPRFPIFATPYPLPFSLSLINKTATRCKNQVSRLLWLNVTDKDIKCLFTLFKKTKELIMERKWSNRPKVEQNMRENFFQTEAQTKK